MDAVEEFLSNLNVAIMEEVNPKLNKAMRLFSQVDDTMKGVVLHASAFTGELTAKNLRDHFDSMELFDSLDDMIEAMEEEIETQSNAQKEG